MKGAELTERGIRLDLMEGPVSCVLRRRIAKLAGVSVATVKREVLAAKRRADAEDDGGFESPVIDVIGGTPEETMDRLAVQVGEYFGIGRFGVRQRAAVRAKEREEELSRSIQSHPWTKGIGGRSAIAHAGGRFVAALNCHTPDCKARHEIGFKTLAGSDQMDRKFQQAGWSVDPATCPAHQRKPQRKAPQTVATAAPTPAAIQAQARMYNLLQSHFDADKGCYSAGWSDDKVAAEAGLSVAQVTGIRDAAFGPIKEPEEITALHFEIAALEQRLPPRSSS